MEGQGSLNLGLPADLSRHHRYEAHVAGVNYISVCVVVFYCECNLESELVERCIEGP